MGPLVSIPKILVISPNDPRSHYSYSGSLRQIVLALERAGALAGAIHAKSEVSARSTSLLKRIGRRIAGNKLSGELRGRMLHRENWSASRLKRRGEIATQLVKEAPIHDRIFVYGTDMKLPEVRTPKAAGMDATYAQLLRSGMEPYCGDTARDGAQAVNHQREMFDSCALIFPRSEWCKMSLIHDYEQSPGKLAVTLGGANLKAATNATERTGRQLLFVGIDWKRKNGQLVLDAFKLARKRIPNLQLDVVSDCPKDLIEPGVTVHGVIKPDDDSKLRTLFSRASALLLPSSFEPWGNVAPEAFEFGCPAIMLDRCAARELINDGVNGIILPDGESWDLANAIIRLLNPEQLPKFSAAASLTARNRLNWDRVAQVIINGISNI